MTIPRSTVVVLDDDPSILRSLERLLSVHGYEVRGYSRPEDLFRAGFPPPPACLVLDQNLGSTKGTAVHADLKLKGCELPTLFLTADWDTRTVVRAIRGGADDYLTKPYDPDELLTAVARAVLRSVALQQFNHDQVECQRRAATLTRRELLIAGLVLSGKLNKQIADQLNLALVTVKVHRGRAMRKLGARNAAEFARLAASAGIGPDPAA